MELRERYGLDDEDVRRLGARLAGDPRTAACREPRVRQALQRSAPGSTSCSSPAAGASRASATCSLGTYAHVMAEQAGGERVCADAGGPAEGAHCTRVRAGRPGERETRPLEHVPAVARRSERTRDRRPLALLAGDVSRDVAPLLPRSRSWGQHRTRSVSLNATCKGRRRAGSPAIAVSTTAAAIQLNRRAVDCARGRA
jgi:hypothetical protein